MPYGTPQLDIRFPSLGKTFAQGEFIKGSRLGNQLRQMKLEDYPEDRAYLKQQRVQKEDDREQRIRADKATAAREAQQQRFDNFVTGIEIGHKTGSTEAYLAIQKAAGIKNPPPIEFDKNEDGEVSAKWPTEKGTISIEAGPEEWEKLIKYMRENPNALASEKGLTDLAAFGGQNGINFEFEEKEPEPTAAEIKRKSFLQSQGSAEGRAAGTPSKPEYTKGEALDKLATMETKLAKLKAGSVVDKELVTEFPWLALFVDGKIPSESMKLVEDAFARYKKHLMRFVGDRLTYKDGKLVSK